MPRGYFGVGVFHPKREQNIGTLLRSAAAFGASYIFTVGRRYVKQLSDTPDAAKHVPLFHYDTVEQLTNSLPKGCRLIGVELADKAHQLNTYCHPLQACYLLGAEDHSLTPAVVDACDDLVVVPGAKWCLNVATVGSIVLYDRLAKSSAFNNRGV